MIPNRLTVDQLDNYFQTATYVERYMPSPHLKNQRTDMFNLIQRLYGIGKDKDCYKGEDKPKLKIRLNSEQLQVYEFCILLLVKANEKDRDIIQLRNFPYKRSFRILKRFFMPISHEQCRIKYYNALYDLLKLYHLKGRKYFLK
nr:putative RNA polymerase sigma factor [uncultured Mediterranean phage uvMED]